MLIVRPIIFFTVLLLCVLLHTSMQASPTLRLSDRAGLLGAEQTTQINTLLNQLSNDDVSFYVQIIPSFGLYEPQKYAHDQLTDIINGNQNQATNTLLILVSLNERQFIITPHGTGQQAPGNFDLARIKHSYFLPYFSTKQYTKGLNEGLRALHASLTDSPAPPLPSMGVFVQQYNNIFILILITALLLLRFKIGSWVHIPLSGLIGLGYGYLTAGWYFAVGYAVIGMALSALTALSTRTKMPEPKIFPGNGITSGGFLKSIFAFWNTPFFKEEDKYKLEEKIKHLESNTGVRFRLAQTPYASGYTVAYWKAAFGFSMVAAIAMALLANDWLIKLPLNLQTGTLVAISAGLLGAFAVSFSSAFRFRVAGKKARMLSCWHMAEYAFYKYLANNNHVVMILVSKFEKQAIVKTSLSDKDFSVEFPQVSQKAFDLRPGKQHFGNDVLQILTLFEQPPIKPNQPQTGSQSKPERGQDEISQDDNDINTPK